MEHRKRYASGTKRSLDSGEEIESKRNRRSDRSGKAHHPRSPFADSQGGVDLAVLCLQDGYSELEPFLVPSGNAFKIDWRSANAQRAVTKALLHKLFGLEVELPVGRLVPPVPQRLNYLLWIEDLILMVKKSLGGKYCEQEFVVRGIDVGTGASCILSLIAASKKFGWLMTATEIDSVSLEYAKENARRNTPQLANSVRVLEGNMNSFFEGIIFTDESSCVDEFAVTMCNPPFFCSNDGEDKVDRVQHPLRELDAANVEICCPGGEEAFILRMVDESKKYSDRVIWFSSMLGKKKTLKAVKRRMFELGAVVQTTEFLQGKQARWGIAWSFHPDARQCLEQIAINCR